MSTWTGAPSACAFALGLNDMTNGTAAIPTPAAPATLVATLRKCRRFRPDFSLIELVPLKYSDSVGQSRRAARKNRPNYTQPFAGLPTGAA